MDKNLSNFFAERGFKYKASSAKITPSISSLNDDIRVISKKENDKFSSEGSVKDYKEAYQELKLEIVKLYMDVKVKIAVFSSSLFFLCQLEINFSLDIRNKDEIAKFGDEEFKDELVELYDINTQTIIAYIKQSIEILLMMKDDEYSEEIQKQKKKNQQLNAALSSKKKKHSNMEDDFVQQIKAKAKQGIFSGNFRFIRYYYPVNDNH